MLHPLSTRRPRPPAVSVELPPSSESEWTPVAPAATWCRTGPVFTIDEWVVEVVVSSDVAMLDSATGPTQVVVTVPTGVRAELVSTDDGFGWGYAVTLRTSATLTATSRTIPVRVEVHVPSSDESLPVKVDLVPREPGAVGAGWAYGPANRWLPLQTG